MELMTEEKKRLRETDLGNVPDEWQVYKFGDLILDMKGGASLSKRNYTDHGIKVIPKGGVGRGGLLNVDNEDQNYCSYEYYKKNLNNTVDKKYTIIVLRDLVPSGPNIGLMVNIDSDETYILAQGVYGFRVNPELTIPEYLVHLSNSNQYRKLMQSILVGSTQVHVRNTTLKNVEIPLPPTLEEQQAIASALSDVDELIRSLDGLIQKKQAIKKGTMQQLLSGKKRLPGFDGEWEVRRLGDVTNIIMGSSPSSSNYNTEGNGLPLIGGNADIKNRKTIKRVWTTQITKTCDAGDVIMTVRAPVGTIGISTDEACLGRGVCALKASYLDTSFLYHQMIYSEPKWKILEQGSTFTSANSNQIEGFELALPPTKKEQKDIAQILSDMDRELQILRQKREKYVQIKQGMMQELLTGKTRLV